MKNIVTSDEIPKNLRLFFNQSFFVYDDILYLKIKFIGLLHCELLYNLYKKDINYLIFFGDDKLYFLGRGEVDEIIEEKDSSTTFILKGQNFEFNNFIFINDIFNNKFTNNRK